MSLQRPPTIKRADTGPAPRASAAPAGKPRLAPPGASGSAVRNAMGWGAPPTTLKPQTTTQRRVASAGAAGIGGGGGGGGGASRLKKPTSVPACSYCGNTFLIKGRCQSCLVKKKMEDTGKVSNASFKKALKEMEADKRREMERKEQVSRRSFSGPRQCESAGCDCPPKLPGTDIVGPPTAEHLGTSRMDLIEPWESAASGERYPPCLTIVYAPSNFNEETDERVLNKEPNAKLHLEHIYGYRGKDCQDNVHWLSSGEILFHAAATAIIYNIASNKQRFFMAHDDDIVSATIFTKYEETGPNGWTESGINDSDDVPTRRIAATGQVGKYPQIYIWDTVTLEILARIGKEQVDTSKGHKIKKDDDEFFHLREVRGLSFSRDGSRLATYGGDDNHKIAVYDWAAHPKPKLVFTQNGHQGIVCGIKFNPFSTGAEFVTIGDKHIKFWDALSKQGQNGLFGKTAETQFVLSASFVPTGQTLTGVQNGDIYIWDGGAVVGQITAHPRTPKARGGVTALKFIEGNEPLILSGGRDGFIRLWNFKRRDTPLGEVHLQFEDRPDADVPNSIDYIRLDGPSGGAAGASRGRTATSTSRGAVSDAPECSPAFVAEEFFKAEKNDLQGMFIIGTKANSIVIVGLKKTEAGARGGMGIGPGPLVIQTRTASSKPAMSPARGSGKSDMAASGAPKVYCAGKYSVVDAHSGTLDGLDCHPSQPLVATASKDGTVRVWDYNKKDSVDPGFIPTKVPNTACAWHPHGLYLAVGHVNGKFSMFKAPPDLNVEKFQLHTVQTDRREDISDIRFSPITPTNECYLGVASRDNFVDIYDVERTRKGLPEPKVAHIGHGAKEEEEGAGGGGAGATGGPGATKKKAAVPTSKQQDEAEAQKSIARLIQQASRNKEMSDTNAADMAEAMKSTADSATESKLPRRLVRTGVCSGHSSYVTHIDFSVEGALMASTCGANELLYWQVPTGAQNPQSQDIKDTEWATQSCTLGWSLKSIWPPCSDGTDVNAVSRSSDKKYVVTADDFGHVKLFQYPVVGPKQRFRAYIGHSSFVQNIRFSAGDKKVFSVGGDDMSLFQWRFEKLADDMGDRGAFTVHTASTPGAGGLGDTRGSGMYSP